MPLTTFTMLPRQSWEPPADVLFNYGAAIAVFRKDGLDKVDADQAVVLLLKAAHARWPLEELGSALAVVYNAWEIPQLYAVRDDGRVIGYLAMPRNDHLTPDQINQTYWRILHENTVGPTVPTPFNCEGLAFGQPVGLLAYESNYGVEIPLKAVNHAIWYLYSQVQWPGEPLFLYPVHRGEEIRFSGILIAQYMENYGETAYTDDSFVGEIVELNRNPKITTQFPSDLQPVRFE